jgi:hypothetical protein
VLGSHVWCVSLVLSRPVGPPARPRVALAALCLSRNVLLVWLCRVQVQVRLLLSSVLCPAPSGLMVSLAPRARWLLAAAFLLAVCAVGTATRARADQRESPIGQELMVGATHTRAEGRLDDADLHAADGLSPSLLSPLQAAIESELSHGGLQSAESPTMLQVSHSTEVSAEADSSAETERWRRRRRRHRPAPAPRAAAPPPPRAAAPAPRRAAPAPRRHHAPAPRAAPAPPAARPHHHHRRHRRRRGRKARPAARKAARRAAKAAPAPAARPAAPAAAPAAKAAPAPAPAAVAAPAPKRPVAQRQAAAPAPAKAQAAPAVRKAHRQAKRAARKAKQQAVAKKQEAKKTEKKKPVKPVQNAATKKKKIAAVQAKADKAQTARKALKKQLAKAKAKTAKGQSCRQSAPECPFIVCRMLTSLVPNVLLSVAQLKPLRRLALRSARPRRRSRRRRSWLPRVSSSSVVDSTFEASSANVC